MFSNVTFNWDVLQILVITIIILVAIRVVTAMIWSKWDYKDFNENKPIIDKAFYTATVLTVLGVFLFTVFNGYESTHRQADMGTEAIKQEAREFVAPTVIDIEADETARVLKKKLKEEARIKKEKEESKRAYEEALNN